MEGMVLGFDSGGGGAVDDLKYVSGLSTILVAHIQEVKDRVSQIEFIFCRQLFAHFQAQSKLHQARLADGAKANEDEWKKREASLVRQLEELSIGQRLAEERLQQLGSSLEETKGKLADAERLVVTQEAEKKQIMGRLEEEMRKAEVIHRLEKEIEEKAAEVVREREAHHRLLRQVELKDNDLVLEQSKQRTLIEDCTQLRTKYKQLEREIEEKAAEVAREREAHQRLLRQVELKDTDLVLEQSKQRALIEDYTQLKTKYKQLEREIEEKAAEVAREREAHQRLLQQVEMKDKDLNFLLSEKKGFIEKYKKVKAENNYFRRKTDQNQGSKPPVDTSVDRKGPESSPSKRKLKDLERADKDSGQAVSSKRDLKRATSDIQADEHASSVRSRLGNSRLALPSGPTNSLPKNDASGSKRESNVGLPSLHWRETRARKESGVADPHDDFLDTPLEAVKSMIKNPTTPGEAQALAACPPQDMEFNNSDDETQDINVATQRLNNRPNMPVQQQNKISVQPPKKEFKYRESVRKKADRENLKGVECKQCKKFYDAVLPDGRVNGDGVGSTSLRCEHHDGVSRHRYRYAPPLTPEGFWNIGFESEM
ncbi:hypothetical protein EJB05_41557 [Eragrostis curvula]|uniref:DNA endonuclease activator Ctp1 C-terminal domain-containing protein n=1 Tax=Eragrostis curvula TaxID=38414 RepID=A0A5J9T9Y6_9POAL|nr:hypothetical protein EJB05_41557 [Eragrostis curvula]